MKPEVSVYVLLGVMTVAIAAQTPKYGVTVTADKKTNFAALKTYVWTRGQPSFDKIIDRQIIAAVDRELAALGMTKHEAEPTDVLVTYYSLSRTDVDTKSKPDDKGLSRQYPVGSLMVAFLDPRSHRRLLQARVDTPIVTERAKLEVAIDAAVAEMFARYPTRRK